MEYRYQTHFSLSDANEAIAALEEAFLRIRELMAPAQADGADAMPRKVRRNGNGNKPEAGMSARIAAANEILSGLSAQGILIRNWQSGLVDFPHIREGREVLLCHEPADGDTVCYYHEIDAGCDARIPVQSGTERG